MNFKNIHIGEMIETLVTERRIELPRICNFFKSSEEDIEKMYKAKSMDTEALLKWSKLLEYDFFRIYSQHMILYAPHSPSETQQGSKKISLPQFRKNIYTQEIIDFILEQVHKGEMSRIEIMKRYRIPKTTLYKWINKYNTEEN
ncbi:helix-turn-helix domain-containing protein [Chryseobacterium sp. c4a]|uniref:helix-turn-helix domain-containing protein n=1 Tax=Chryseobacterium sp. c4a TaxID=1573582 RepID=UPI00135A07E0|nr:helix-turn-helix domain-containing protein [Chryseobacterium sp. c4a]